MTDVQALAYNVLALPSPKRLTVAQLQAVQDNAIYKYWLAHREVGLPLTAEMALDDGTTAQITSTGAIMHWLGGDEVEVV